MRAELLKTRLLPTPRITLALAALAVAGTALGVYLAQPDDAGNYLDFPMTAAEVATEIGAIIFGVWLATVEFAQGTMRRALTAEPRRPRLVAGKLGVLVAVTAVGSFLVALAGFWLGALAADLRGVDYDHGGGAKLIGAIVLVAVLAALLAFALGLLAESFAGGLVLAFAVVFVLDGVLSFVDAIKDYTFAAALGDITASAHPDQAADLGLGAAIGVAVVWVVVVLALGLARFQRTDLK